MTDTINPTAHVLKIGMGRAMSYEPNVYVSASFNDTIVFNYTHPEWQPDSYEGTYRTKPSIKWETDPETGEVLPEGEWGELVITTVDREATPVVRYRTRDITRIIPGTCKCGRTHRRIDRLHGRTDDMLIIRGVNVFPSQIEDVMKTFDEISSWYQIELTRKNHLDVVTLKVEPNPSFAFDEVRAVELLQRSVSERLKSALSVGLRVLIVPPGSIPRSEGKAVRVKDLRGDDK
jgi:phenylacetate-CoA ligase